MLTSFPFAAFVLWLLAVPMDGPLTAAAGLGGATGYFLLPHALTLMAVALWLPPKRFKQLIPYAVLATLALTLAIPLFPRQGSWLLSGLSFTGAFVAVEACCRLHSTRRPVLAAAAGLVMANLLLFVLHRFPGGSVGHFVLVTLPLLLLLSPLPAAGKKQAAHFSVPLWRYLPFVLVFHIVGGLMYGSIYPAYQPVALVAGLELFFYVATVLGAVWLAEKSQDLALIFGIVLSMASFALLQYPQPLNINLSMFAMQAGQGFVDLFLLAFLLSFARPVRAFGLGLAILCLGIYGGQLFGRHLQDMAGAIALSGHIVLNLSVLMLYFLSRQRHPLAAFDRTASGEGLSGALEDSDRPAISEVTAPSAEDLLPENIRLLLSERECMVLAQSLDGRPYRQIASDLAISESTVKTYMKRICDKLDVKGRKGLYEALGKW